MVKSHTRVSARIGVRVMVRVNPNPNPSRNCSRCNCNPNPTLSVTHRQTLPIIKPGPHLIPSFSRWIISKVDPHGQFAALGVHPGWRVVAMNGTMISSSNQEVRVVVLG